MNAIELFHADGKPAGVHYCGKCRNVARTKEQADQCCLPTVCACGAEAQQYHTQCRACENKANDERERTRFEKAEKVTEWDGPIYSDGHGYHDGYFESLEDFEDWFANAEEVERPAYVWTCDVHPIISLDYDNVIENASQEAYEDWEPTALKLSKELTEAIEAFNEANKGETYWTYNSKRALVMPPQPPAE